MKIVIVRRNCDDYEESQELSIDGKSILSVGPLCECPEDAIIGRDLVDCCRVAGLMKRAFDASGAGETFNLEIVKEEQ